MVRAYFLADVISILADYVCYYHYPARGPPNAGLARLDPSVLHGNLREVIGIVESYTEPGPFRDSLLTRFARAELLGRLHERGFLEHPPSTGRRCSRRSGPWSRSASRRPSIRSCACPPHHDGPGPGRAPRPAVALAEAEVQVTGSARAIRLDATDRGTLHLAAEARLDAGQRPFEVHAVGDRLMLEVPGEVAAAYHRRPGRFRAPLSGVARLVIRRRDDSAELVVPASVEQRVEQGDAGDLHLTFLVDADIDPATIASGEPAWSGTWEVVIQIEVAGYVREAHVRLDDERRTAGGGSFFRRRGR